MSDSTPLLLLIDSILSGNDREILSCLQEIRSLLNDPCLPDPRESKDALCHVISRLGNAHPEMVRTKSSHDGSLPLHFAATLGQTSVAQVLLSMYPDAATMPNAKGKIPLHYAAREGKVDMVRFFLHSVPETATIASDKDKLALHFAAGDGHTQVVRDLLTVYPAGASLPSAKGKLPLHFAARWGHLQIAHDLLSVHPAGVSALDWEGSLPLHDAAREGQYRMSRYLIERYPPALSTANLRSEIPLFPAVRSGNLDLVVLLAQAWPRGAQHVLANLCTDDNVHDLAILQFLLRAAVRNFQNCSLLQGREPPTVCLSDDLEVVVHTNVGARGKSRKQSKKTQPSPSSSFSRSKSPILDCDDKKRPAGDSSLVVQHGERKRLRVGLAQVQPRVFYPLHAAFQVGASSHVLEIVLGESSEDQQNQRDRTGRLPLHWALKNCCRQDDERIPLVLRLINSESAGIRDSEHQQLPLHIAIASQADVGILTALLEVYPTAGIERCGSTDEWNDKLPIEMAVQYDCDLSTIYHLLRVDPSIVRD